MVKSLMSREPGGLGGEIAGRVAAGGGAFCVFFPELGAFNDLMDRLEGGVEGAGGSSEGMLQGLVVEMRAAAMA